MPVITLIYLGAIQLITHKNRELIEIKQNFLMVSLLAQLFFRYPQLLIHYFPNAFHLRLNDQPPHAHTVLSDGDVVKVKETFQT